MALRVLFIGGNGIISSASSASPRGTGRRADAAQLRAQHRAAADRRARATSSATPTTRHPIVAAIGDETFGRRRELPPASRPPQVERDLGLFEGRCGQYVYISSASAYQKPVAHLPITEPTPLRAPALGSTRATRSRARTCSSPPIASAASRPPSSGRRTPTTAPACPLLGGWTAIDRMRHGKPEVVAGRRHEPLDPHPHARLRRRVHRVSSATRPRRRRGVPHHVR